MPNELVAIPSNGVETYRMSTDAANICGAIVKATAKDIQGRKYVCVEGWQAIAVAHGCAATSCGVERVDGGVKATGQVRRMDTGAVIAEAEGFVGEDEATWFGGEAEVWDKQARMRVKKMLPKRADFAIRAMAQTRAISRACRSAFAHVVVLIDKDLGTTPAEEMMGVIDHDPGANVGRGRGNWVDEARQDGIVDDSRPKGQMPGKAATNANGKKTAAEKAKDWTDKAIQTLNLGDHTADSLKAFWTENADKIEWMEENLPDQHERFLTAYDNAAEAAKARAA
jgi:hypothetical protein